LRRLLLWSTSANSSDQWNTSQQPVERIWGARITLLPSVHPEGWSPPLTHPQGLIMCLNARQGPRGGCHHSHIWEGQARSSRSRPMAETERGRGERIVKMKPCHYQPAELSYSTCWFVFT
jgi:hypothetical protein